MNKVDEKGNGHDNSGERRWKGRNGNEIRLLPLFLGDSVNGIEVYE